MTTSTLIPQNRIKDLVTTLETLQTNIQNNVVMRVNTASRVYGTDSSGNQTTYDKEDFGKVDDVKVNGTSIVTNKVANLNNYIKIEKVSSLPASPDASTLYCIPES